MDSSSIVQPFFIENACKLAPRAGMVAPSSLAAFQLFVGRAGGRGKLAEVAKSLFCAGHMYGRKRYFNIDPYQRIYRRLGLPKLWSMHKMLS